MKKTNRLIVGAIAIALSLVIAFSGVALAAQTSFEVVVNDGSVRIQTSVRSTTEGDVPPYDETGYNFRAIAIHGNSEIARTVNTDTGVDTQTHFTYIPANGLKKAFIEEEVKTARVGKGDNFTICCDSYAQTRFLTSAVNYESAAFSENNDLLLALNVAGYGRGMVQAEENKQIGDENATWTDSQTKDWLAVSGGWNVSLEIVNIGCDFPAMGTEKKALLCPFFKP